MSATLVLPRPGCEVHTTCQPASAWGKGPGWPAVIRAIDPLGVEMTLSRRFEIGSGLAISLPGEGSSSSVVLARVVTVAPFGPAGWRLACQFVSELGAEEVEQVLHLDPSYRACLAGDGDTVHEASPQAVTEVLFAVAQGEGRWLRWVVRHLDLAANWPVPAGAMVTLGIAGPDDALPPVDLTVRDCRLRGERWVVEAVFASAPHPEVLRLLQPPA